MNSVSVHLKQPISNYLKFLANFSSILHGYPYNNYCYATNVDIIDVFSSETIQKFPINAQKSSFSVFHDQAIRNFYKDADTAGQISSAIDSMPLKEFETHLMELATSNKNQVMGKVITECLNKRKCISKQVLRKLLAVYSSAGKVDIVEIIINYCSVVIPEHYNYSGKFLHYLGKAQCLKGNTNKGLSIIKDCYETNENLRGVYRVVLRELIHDSVLNRSEATLVVFKKHVLEYSDKWDDHYPLICLWHICWISSWFSDQQLAEELLESSEKLKDIIRDKSSTFSLSVLKNESNDDAVLRLLQSLLKYKMMSEYSKVLQVLFSYKLKNHDLRGCREIIRNCELLGIHLSPSHQEEYIHMLIMGKKVPKSPPKYNFRNFKFKF